MKISTLVQVLFATASLTPAAIIVTTEAPGVQQSSVAGVITENFNSFGTGVFGNQIRPIGTYSVDAQIVGSNLYGGANQTNYISVGAQSNSTSYTLTLNSLSSYFGLYWAAADSLNRLEFFDGAVSKGVFTRASFIGLMAAGHFGNPNAPFAGQNGTEPYAYLNFTASDAGSYFNRIVFSNTNTSTGFETDNHSALSAVPEPSSYAMMGAGLVGLAAYLKRRRA